MSERHPSILMSTLKTASALALASYCATVWLARSELDQVDPRRVLAALRHVDDDPITTGSIGRAADGMRLDPCTLRGRR